MAERTPEEMGDMALARVRVRAVLAEAYDSCVSYYLTEHLHDPGDVVERWIDAVWDGIRTLQPEDRVMAIVMLLEPSTRAAAAALHQEMVSP